MGQIPKCWVTFQQVISKPGLFLFKPAEQGDIKMSAATSVEGLKTILCTQKRQITWPRIHSKTGQGVFSNISPCFLVLLLFLVFFLEAELTLPDLSLGRCLADPLNPGHPRSCVSVRLSLSCPQDQESRPSAGHSQK